MFSNSLPNFIGKHMEYLITSVAIVDQKSPRRPPPADDDDDEREWEGRRQGLGFWEGVQLERR